MLMFDAVEWKNEAQEYLTRTGGSRKTHNCCLRTLLVRDEAVPATMEEADKRKREALARHH